MAKTSGKVSIIYMQEERMLGFLVEQFDGYHVLCDIFFLGNCEVDKDCCGRGGAARSSEKRHKRRLLHLALCIALHNLLASHDNLTCCRCAHLARIFCSFPFP